MSYTGIIYWRFICVCVQLIPSLAYNFIVCANIICYAYCVFFFFFFFLLIVLSGLSFHLPGFHNIFHKILCDGFSVYGPTGMYILLSSTFIRISTWETLPVRGLFARSLLFINCLEPWKCYVLGEQFIE
jgi:hypothetical protein